MRRLILIGGIILGIFANCNSVYNDRVPFRVTDRDCVDNGLRAEEKRNTEVASRDKPAAKLYLMEVTAYSHTGNRTASGTWPRRGTVAVDTDYIPFGTRLFVQGYGWGIAADRGGVIKGVEPVEGDGKANLDVFFPDRQDAVRWGRRVVEVWVEEGGNR